MDARELKWTRPAIAFTDPRELPFSELRSRGELPHLYKLGGSYFVTFRLWDAVELDDEPVPASHSWMKRASRPCTLRSLERQRWIEIHKLMDQPGEAKNVSLAWQLAELTEPPLTLGSCCLQIAEIAETVERCLLHFDLIRYCLHAWCVMPNHVHVVYTAAGEFTPEVIHHSWKSYLGHQINRILNRSGPVWERESFDHLIRSPEHFEAYINYTEQNPVVAGLSSQPALWPYSSARFT